MQNDPLNFSRTNCISKNRLVMMVLANTNTFKKHVFKTPIMSVCDQSFQWTLHRNYSKVVVVCVVVVDVLLLFCCCCSYCRWCNFVFIVELLMARYFALCLLFCGFLKTNSPLPKRCFIIIYACITRTYS